MGKEKGSGESVTAVVGDDGGGDGSVGGWLVSWLVGCG